MEGDVTNGPKRQFTWARFLGKLLMEPFNHRTPDDLKKYTLRQLQELFASDENSQSSIGTNGPRRANEAKASKVPTLDFREPETDPKKAEDKFRLACQAFGVSLEKQDAVLEKWKKSQLPKKD